MTYRVYLDEGGHWRDFGVDYPSKEAAEKAADRFRESFPSREYRVRRVGGSRNPRACVGCGKQIIGRAVSGTCSGCGAKNPAPKSGRRAYVNAYTAKEGLSYPAGVYKILDRGHGWDVLDAINSNGEEVSVYAFSVNWKRKTK